MARTRGNFGHDKKDKKAVIAVAQRINNFDLSLAADESLWGDRDVAMAAVASNGTNFRLITEELKADPEVVSVAVTNAGHALMWCSDRFKSDPAIVIAAIKSTGVALQYADPELANDPKIVRLAIEQDGRSLEYASNKFKNDKETVLTALTVGTSKGHGGSTDHWILHCASTQLRGDRDVVQTAIQNCGGLSLMHASEELQRDRDLVLAAVKDCGEALQFADPVLQADRKIVTKAVEQSGAALRYASTELKGDRHVAMAALKAPEPFIVANVLDCVSEELKNDREFVLQAVAASGFNLKFASTELQGDRKIVETALQNGNGITRAYAILEHASKELRGDRRLVCQAISDDSLSLHIASKELQLDPAIVSLAWETVREDHDFDMWHHFIRDLTGRSNLRAVYLEQVLTLKKDLKQRNELDKFDLKDPNSTVQVAEKWLSESLEKQWLTRQIPKTTSVPGVLLNCIVTFTGVEEDILVATKLLRFSSVLCYMKKGLEENWSNEIWEDFVNEASAVGLLG